MHTPTILLFGFVKTRAAGDYATGQYDANNRELKLDMRQGRDAVRVGELMRRGYRVLTVSNSTDVESSADHINRDFNVPVRADSTTFRSLATEVKIRLAGQRLDWVCDDWVYIPKGRLPSERS